MTGEKSKTQNNKVIPTLRAAVNNLVGNRVILFPFCIIAFVQLFILEILYFAPRFPLKVFFGPIIRKIWSENYLHYPLNFSLLPKLMQYAQIPIYIFISSFFIAVAVAVIVKVNNGKGVKMKTAIKETLNSYVHIVIAALISYILVVICFKLFGLVYNRALEIRSQSGIFYILKQIILIGAPYFNLLLSIFVTTLFIYVIPIIIIEKKKVFSAILLNFKTLLRSFWFTLGVVLIPSLFYVPLLLLRNNISPETFVPEAVLYVLILTTFVLIAIDAVVYTAISTSYLLNKETK